MILYESMTPSDLAGILTHGARTAILKLTVEWQTASEGYFKSSAVEFIIAQYRDSNGESLLCEKTYHAKKKVRAGWINTYRLTPLGLQVQQAL
jgi:hypothetical protein